MVISRRDILKILGGAGVLAAIPVVSPAFSGVQPDDPLREMTKLMNNGWLAIYDTPRPPSVNTYVGYDPLVMLRFGSPAFGEPMDSEAVANPITPDCAVRTGSVRWFRIFTADMHHALFDGNIGTHIDEADLMFPSTSIMAGSQITVSSWILRHYS